MANSKKEQPHIEKSLNEMGEKNRKSFFKALISLVITAAVISFFAINLFSCRSESEFTIPQTPVDYLAMLDNSSYQPVGRISWQDVPACLKTVSSLSFSGTKDNLLLVRILSDSGSEEGIFRLLENNECSLSVMDISFTVHVSDKAIRLINDSGESLDFILIE